VNDEHEALVDAILIDDDDDDDDDAAAESADTLKRGESQASAAQCRAAPNRGG
jgi:hypothetical protein